MKDPMKDRWDKGFYAGALVTMWLIFLAWLCCR